MKRDELIGLITKEGNPVPLNKVDVRGTLTGRGARVKVTQVFENREPGSIEAVYKFPLPENSTVCRFKTVVGDKVTEGTVEERDKAFHLYDEALSRGDGGYLLDEERPNIFTLSVGNLNPGTSASIEIEYVALLDAKGTEVRFFLPTTISPRYVPERTPDEKGIPVDELVNPPISSEVSYRLSIFLQIEGKETISSIDSPSHTISQAFEDEVIRAEFTSGAVVMDRDFVLNIHYKDLFRNRGYFFSNEKGNFLQLDLCPSESAAESNGVEISAAEKEIIFLLDCSGSMEGDSILQAKTALEIFLKALKEGTRFNLYRFGSRYEKLSPESLPYNAETLKEMLNRLKRVNANLGGTEVLAPLKEIYQSKPTDGYFREVILITDGQIGNESEIMELIKKGDQGSRLFTVGIGYGPNEYFIRQLTRVAGGTSEFITPGERIEPKILRLFKQVMSGRIDDLKIDWDNDNLQTEQAPFNPVLFSRESMSIFARAKEGLNTPKEIPVSFRMGKSRKEWSIPVQEVRGEGAPVHLLWAKERIRDFEEGTAKGFKKGSRQAERRGKQVRDEIIRLSRDFGILSRETSFVAIETRTGDEKTRGEVVPRKVPVMLTKGWGGVDLRVNGLIPGTAMRMMNAQSVGRPISFSLDMADYSVRQAPKPQRSPKRPCSFDLSDRPGEQDILMNILSLQKAEGGFEIDKELSRRMGITIAELKKLSGKIEAIGKADMLTLLSTAIILQLLKKYYSDREDEWRDLLEKTERWFKNEVSRTEPRIDGIHIEDWAAQFIKTLKFRITL
jgi:Ca-activated chloride channel family protein